MFSLCFKDLNLCYLIISLLYRLYECLHSVTAYVNILWIFNLFNDAKISFCTVQKIFYHIETINLHHLTQWYMWLEPFVNLKPYSRKCFDVISRSSWLGVNLAVSSLGQKWSFVPKVVNVLLIIHRSDSHPSWSPVLILETIWLFYIVAPHKYVETIELLLVNFQFNVMYFLIINQWFLSTILNNPYGNILLVVKMNKHFKALDLEIHS